MKPARRSILEMFNVFYSLYEPPELPLEILSPISRSTPFSRGLSTARLRALVAYFGASV